MGGFRVCNPDSSIEPFTLDPEDLEPYLKDHDIDISELEIQDRSKGDVLAKSLVLLQVSWFILQVVARAVQHLAVTELEIATLAFAILNIMTYLCWWNKPLDVNLPIKITTDHSGDSMIAPPPSITASSSYEARSLSPAAILNPEPCTIENDPTNSSALNHPLQSHTLTTSPHDLAARLQAKAPPTKKQWPANDTVRLTHMNRICTARPKA
ncbi:hypothetical protein DXG01_015737 [Tephrocybe rancida]|nr:hypothetical protein DXG01_015737 [Tephrocybe rancida]